MNTDQRILEKSIQGHTEETVRIIENFDDSDIAKFIASLATELSVLILDNMTRYKAALVLEKIDYNTALTIIEKLPLSKSKVLLMQVDQALCNKMLKDLPTQISRPLKVIFNYPENTLGAHMDTTVFTLPAHDTVDQALGKVKKHQAQILSQVLVINKDQSLAGFVELTDLIASEGKTPILSLLHKNLPQVSARIDIRALKKEKLWDESCVYLPVQDDDGIFLGTLTRKDLKEYKQKKNKMDLSVIQAGAALGDLYRIGLSSLIQGHSESENQKTR